MYVHSATYNISKPKMGFSIYLYKVRSSRKEKNNNQARGKKSILLIIFFDSFWSQFFVYFLDCSLSMVIALPTIGIAINSKVVSPSCS